jgi:hypothetical protein
MSYQLRIETRLSLLGSGCGPSARSSELALSSGKRPFAGFASARRDQPTTESGRAAAQVTQMHRGHGLIHRNSLSLTPPD